MKNTVRDDLEIGERVSDKATRPARPDGSVSSRPASRGRVSRSGWLAALLLSLALLVAGCDVGSGGGATQSSGGTASGLGAGATVAVPPAAQDLQQTIIAVINAVQPSVVEVQSKGSRGGAIGSGEIVTADGYIVTNDHVVAGFSSFTVLLSNGQSMPARLVGASPQDDLAVLKVNTSSLRPIAFADSSKVQVGQFAIAIGSPLGLQQSATFGIVSALNRTAGEGQGGPASVLTGLIQTSAPINPGNSGGALVDLQGRLIGVPTLAAANPESGTPAGGIGFAIPSDRVKFVADQIIKNGKLVTTGQGFIGIAGVDVTPDLAAAYSLPADHGVLIRDFVPDAKGSSPAQRAGLKTGDIIIAVNGKQITSSGDLASALISQNPGTQVTVTVQRGSNKQDVKVTLGERPTNAPG
jgi:S1-C subfamily serine protease